MSDSGREWGQNTDEAIRKRNRMKTSLRLRADKASEKRCKGLIAVLENPSLSVNIGSVIRNVDALGVEKLYVVDSRNVIPDKWEDMRTNKHLNSVSASAVKWSFVKKYKTSAECLDYLEYKGFKSFATSPHTLGKVNVSLPEADFTDKRVAVWFGNESRGISQEVLDRCEKCVNIEMGGIIESLNLGTSTGIVLHEATKQRREFEMDALEKKRGNVT